MINNIFPLVRQAAAQAAAESVSTSPFGTAASWIDDAIILRLVYG
jgi:hypothetical protein